MSELAALGPPVLGADLGHPAALMLDRAERDRLVIFDPSSAPLLRPLIVPDDLRPWHAAPSGRWALAIPAGYTAALAPGGPDEEAALAALQARHPALGRHLRGHAPAATRPAAGWWWELASAPALPPGPRILLGPGAISWDESEALVAAPTAIIPAADPFWLALLWAWTHGPNTTKGRRDKDAGTRATLTPDTPDQHASLTLPDFAQLPGFSLSWYSSIPEPARVSLGGLALSAAGIAGQLAEHERAVLRRLLADFGPPGARPSPRLARWWELEFAELRTAIVAALRNDIPERFRAAWERAHAEQRADRAAALGRLAAVEAAVDAQVAGLLMENG